MSAASSCAGSATTGQTFGRELEHDLDLLAERAGQQPRDLVDQIVDVDRCGLQRLAAGEGEQPARKSAPRNAASSASPASSSTVGVLLHDTAQHVEIADDDCEQVVEVMRHAAGEVADRLHLLRLNELGLGLASLGDVLSDPEHV